jgi:hypothetical protein
MQVSLCSLLSWIENKKFTTEKHNWLKASKFFFNVILIIPYDKEYAPSWEKNIQAW